MNFREFPQIHCIWIMDGGWLFSRTDFVNIRESKLPFLFSSLLQKSIYLHISFNSENKIKANIEKDTCWNIFWMVVWLINQNYKLDPCSCHCSYIRTELRYCKHVSCREIYHYKTLPGWKTPAAKWARLCQLDLFCAECFKKRNPVWEVRGIKAQSGRSWNKLQLADF